MKRRHGVYIPLKLRVALTFVAGALWFCFSLWLSRSWIRTLGHDITTPLAILVIAGVALIPGYLNIQLITSILLDNPRPLRFDGDFPRITLLVAAYNEQDSIAETLDYALRAEYPGHFELVVADDGSTDRTREIVAEYAERYPCVRLLAAEHGGKANTLNAALETVSTPLTATIDADTLLMPYSLKHAVARLLVSPPDTVAVAGAVLVRNSRENMLTRAQEWDYFLGIASVKRGQALLQGTLVAQGAFSVYDTTALKLVGGWPNRIGEDIVLTWRMLLQGGRSVFEPTAVAFTDAPSNWGAFVRQRRRWARGMIEGLRDHGWGMLEPAQVLLARGGRQLPVSVRRPGLHACVHPRHPAGDDRQLCDRRADDPVGAAAQHGARQHHVLLSAPSLQGCESARAQEQVAGCCSTSSAISS